MTQQDGSYLPDLARVLTVEVQVSSWKQIYLDLKHSTGHKASGDGLDILHTPSYRELLNRPTPSFPRPSNGTKSEYDAALRTAEQLPASAHYDVDQLKADSAWLSKSLSVCEITALRCTVLEWQGRPQAFLDAGFDEAEIASLAEIGLVAANDEKDSSGFDTVPERRRRLLSTYFQELVAYVYLWAILTQARRHGRDHPFYELCKELSGFEKDIVVCTDTLNEAINTLLDGIDKPSVDEEVLDIWQAGQIQYISAVLDLVLALSGGYNACTKGFAKWLSMLERASCFTELTTGPLLLPEQLQILHSRIALQTISFLGPASLLNSDDLTLEGHWTRDTDVVSATTSFVLRIIEQDTIFLLPVAWSFALMLHDVQERGISAKQNREETHIQRAVEQMAGSDTTTGRRNSSSSSQQESIWEQIIDAVTNVAPSLPDLVEKIYLHTAEHGAVSVLVQMINLHRDRSPQSTPKPLVRAILQLALMTIGYGAEILDIQLAILANDQPRPFDEICTHHTHEAFFVEKIFEAAFARFPYEAVPFLKLARYLALSNHFSANGQHWLLSRLQHAPSFTSSAQAQFSAYHTIREADNLNFVALDNNTRLLTDSGLQYLTTQTPSSAMVIPAQTQGQVISDSYPPVIRWNFQYSVLGMVGSWLELYYRRELQNVFGDRQDATEVITEAILLVTNLVKTTTKQRKEDSQGVDAILDDLGGFLTVHISAAGRVCDILEFELQSHRQASASTRNGSLIAACLQFVTALLDVRPDQFWSLIARTGLTGSQDKKDLSSTTGKAGLNIPMSEDVCEALATLYNRLLDSLSRVPAYKAADQPRSLTGILSARSKQQQDLLYALTSNMIDLLELLPQRPLEHIMSNLDLITSACSSMKKILDLRFLHSSGPITGKLDRCFDSAARLILQRLYLARDGGHTISIIQHITTSCTLRQNAFSFRSGEFYAGITALAHSLLQCAESTSQSSSAFSGQLLRSMPLLVRQFSNSPVSTASLFATALHMTSTGDSNSLLGFLGSQSCLKLLEILSFLRASSTKTVIVSSWKVLSALLSREQRWLSVVILNGQAPTKGSGKQEDKQLSYRGRRFPDIALDQLRTMDRLDATISASMLRFLNNAQQNWLWTFNGPGQEAMFDSWTVFATNVSLIAPADLDNVALITDAWSLRLNYAKAEMDESVRVAFQPLLQWLTTHATGHIEYNSSLHNNLERNFTAKFGFSPAAFQSSNTDSRLHSVYDEDLVHEVLIGHDQSGQANANYAYLEEIRRANSNLTLVNAKITLASSFANLCTEHAAYLAADQTMRITMSHILQNLLTSISRSGPSSSPLEALAQSQTYTCLAVVQQLIGRQKKSGMDFRAILPTAWNCLMSRHSSLEAAIVAEDVAHWRTMMAVILLSLKFHQGTRSVVSSVNPSTLNSKDLLLRSETSNTLLLDIFTVAASALGTAVGTMYQSKQAEMQGQAATDSEIGGQDVLLTVSVLELIIALAHTADIVTQISERAFATNTFESAMKLYTCAHLFSNRSSSEDPFYATPALRVLASLASLSPVAEEMAVDGIFSRLSTARLTQTLQRVPGGVKHLDTRPYCDALYQMWSSGLVPLCVNLLSGVGGAIAAEVISFLNLFPQQLNQITPNLSVGKGDYLTLSVVKEVASLGLISNVADTFRRAGASAAVDPTSISPLTGFDNRKRDVAESASELLKIGSSVLKSRILPTSELEQSWQADGKLVEYYTQELRVIQRCVAVSEGRSTPIDP